eukprot:793672-Pelagomonas_calceolata.AAC.5
MFRPVLVLPILPYPGGPLTHSMCLPPCVLVRKWRGTNVAVKIIMNLPRGVESRHGRRPCHLGSREAV